jgi:hypothetical protein
MYNHHFNQRMVSTQCLLVDGNHFTKVIRNYPFTAEQVRENITNFYSQEQTEGKVKVIVIPDICSIEFGRGVGYDIIERVPPQEIGEISATKIRKEMGL